MNELITPRQMGQADRLTIEGGILGIDLMERAGGAVADASLFHLHDKTRVLVVCGIGNNGGDGFVAARHLIGQGKKVDVYVHGDPKALKGDALEALGVMNASLMETCPNVRDYDLVIDALFGAGLDRDIEGAVAELIAGINASGVPVVSVDLPSGIDGRTGKVRGIAIEARATVTFFRYKPGHFLLPGRLHCGDKVLAQIGIGDEVFGEIRPDLSLNRPENWRSVYPAPSVDAHKYARGHALIVSGPLAMSGAARLMAMAALRIGAGLVTVASPKDALLAHASHFTSVMLHETDTADGISNILMDKRINVLALGPGLPPDENTRTMVLSALAENRVVVLDAGGLTAFKDHASDLFHAIDARSVPIVLTPHEGEFAALFPEDAEDLSKVEKTRSAARKSGAVVLLKGPDTVIAAPDGRATISDNAPPWLATAGSGDVLTGVIAGLLAQSMSVFEAVNAAAWFHAEAANALGPGLVSSDMDEGLRQVIHPFINELISHHLTT